MENEVIQEATYLQFPRDESLQPDARSWEEVLWAVQLLLTNTHDRQTLVLDTINGLERLCFEYICRTQFDGNWGEKGFTAFQRGYDISVPEWERFLELLNRLRDQGMTVLSLAHQGIMAVPNPAGPEYTCFGPEMHKKTWAVTKGRVDAILFGQYNIVTLENDPKKKTKAKGGRERIIHTTQSASHEAKNRHNLSDIIYVSNESPAQAWADLEAAFQGKQNDQDEEQAQP
jgi:hypothetical protein